MSDYPVSEFEARLARAQAAIADAGLDALFITTEPELRWFTGFRTLFWQSPTRPWFLVVPCNGLPIAVIPEIGAPLMARTWLSDIRTWAAPDPHDDGVSLLRDALTPFGRVGMAMGHETSLRMPLADFRALGREFHDATRLLQLLRMVKSEAEIANHRSICGIASRAFGRAGGLFHIGQTKQEAFRAFRMALLEEGADDVPYLVGGAGRFGYDDVISPPDDTRLAAGDVFMLDTGATLNGVFCDFDRNFSFGTPDDAVLRAHETLWLATEAGLSAARPGATAGDVLRAMAVVIEQAGGGTGNIGRLGHGLGMQLTEQPSLVGWDDTVLEAGMVLTLEPSMPVKGDAMLVHEENIVVRDGVPELLSVRETREMRVIG